MTELLEVKDSKWLKNFIGKKIKDVQLTKTTNFYTTIALIFEDNTSLDVELNCSCVGYDGEIIVSDNPTMSYKGTQFLDSMNSSAFGIGENDLLNLCIVRRELPVLTDIIVKTNDTDKVDLEKENILRMEIQELRFCLSNKICIDFSIYGIEETCNLMVSIA